MPELPDVERFRQYLFSTALHQRISALDARDEMPLKDVSEADLRDALVGAELVDTRRHGKWLFADAEPGPWLCLHFGMTGHLVYFEDMEDDPEHDRMLISFANGFHLAYDCQRRLGRVSLTDTVDGFVEREGLGPDAQSLSWDCFREAIEGRTARLKSLLMDQHVIAGLGNILVDEVLFQSRLHPETPIDALDDEHLHTLYGAIRDVVMTTVASRTEGAEIPRDWLMRNREIGGTCPRCGGEIERIRVNQRSTYFCGACQRSECGGRLSSMRERPASCGPVICRPRTTTRADL